MLNGTFIDGIPVFLFSYSKYPLIHLFSSMLLNPAKYKDEIPQNVSLKYKGQNVTMQELNCYQSFKHLINSCICLIQY